MGLGEWLFSVVSETGRMEGRIRFDKPIACLHVRGKHMGRAKLTLTRG
jgi:hypothetical protein